MPQTIADNLRHLLKERGLDADELSRRLGYRTRAMVDHWLAGRRAISRQNLGRVAKALDVDPTAIDPVGNAYTPSHRKTRSVEKAERQRLNGQFLPPPHSRVADTPLNPAGADMGPGDQPLFAQVEGAWKLLRNDEERRAFVEHVRGFVHESTAPEPVRKKAGR